ncbi:MAG: YraN family protein [Chloroflexota bacterium]|nr:YraN family protein [Chloroflexota bacterium]
MSDERVKLGRRGEELAVAALRQEGYETVTRNWHCQIGEVDIVARRGKIWYFFEVRTRRGCDFGTPEESLTPAKRQRMIDVALTYLAEHDLNANHVDWRVGLVAVEMNRTGRLLRLEVYDSIS